MPARFVLGRVVATPAAITALNAAAQPPLPLLDRHARGDWGDVCPQDAAANEEAIVTGARIMSVYTLTGDEQIWVITDAADGDGRRAATIVLLPEDY